MWSKIFGKKIKTAVDSAVVEQIEKATPLVESLDEALEAAKDSALESIVRSEVEKRLSELYIGEEYRQSVLACMTLDKIHNSDEFKAEVRDEGWDAAHEEVFRKVRIMYPRAAVQTGYSNFGEPQIHVHHIVNGISDSILEGMKEC
jgi:uncharacterized membrane-anchored protein YjiN (DUF445 family)